LIAIGTQTVRNLEIPRAAPDAFREISKFFVGMGEEAPVALAEEIRGRHARSVPRAAAMTVTLPLARLARVRKGCLSTHECGAFHARRHLSKRSRRDVPEGIVRVNVEITWEDLAVVLYHKS